MMASVETYLAVRRAVGFTLSKTEYLLRSFVNFATDRKETHIRTATAIDWAAKRNQLRNGTRVTRPFVVSLNTSA